MKFIKTTLCLSVMLALSACGDKETVESHLSSAQASISAKKANESIIALKNAIRLDAKNSQARFLLGQVYLNLGDGAGAVKELERAKSLGHNDKQLIPSLARAYILTESDVEVLELSDDASMLASEQQSHYLAYQTLAALRLENPELAKESVNSAQALSGQSLYSMLADAYLQLSDNNFDESKVLVERILAVDSENVDALMLQAQVATVMQDYQLASESYKKYQTLQPRSGIVQLLLADALLKAGNFNEAEAYADAILASISNQPFAHYIKAMSRFQDKDFANASQHAESALAANFNQLNLKLVAGASAFYLKNWEQATNHLRSVVKNLPKEHLANRMLAVSQLELGLISEISDTLGDPESLGKGESNAEFLSEMSFKLLELGAVDEAKKLVDQNDALNSGDAKTNARQGILKLMMNDPSGIENLKDAVKLDPSLIEAELALAYAALQTGDTQQAIEIATSWQEKYPEKSGGFNLMAVIEIKKENYAEAEALLLKSLTLEPDNLFALTEQIRVAQKQKNQELVETRVSKVLELYPDSTKVLRLYFGTYRNEEALAKLVAARQRDTGSSQKAILLTEAHLSLGQLKEAEAVLASMENTDKLPKRYWQLAVLVSKQQQDTKAMQGILEKWLEANPYHLEPVVLLTDVYASQRDYDRALSLVKRGLENHNDNTILQLVNMQLLLNTKKVSEAKEQYNILALKEINPSLKDGLLGRIFLLEANFVKAVPNLESFYKTYNSAQNAFYLAGAYIGNNDQKKAITLLSDFLSSNPDDVRIKAALAGLYLEEDKEQAIKYYEDIVGAQPKNAVINNNLAWLYLEKGNIEQALVHAKAAFDVAPQIANVVDTYGQALLKSGDKVAALTHASQAVELTKGADVDISLNYAEALISNGHYDKAKTVLDSIKPQTATQETKKLTLATQL